MSKTTENYGLTKPEVGEFFSLETWNGNMDKIDKELKKREDAQKESDNSLMNPEFTESKERKNLTSGEKIHLMLGKISKFFSDMKEIAFSGSYNDLVDKPKIPTVLNNQTTTEEGYALDARQANPNIDGTLAKQLSDLNGSLKTKISNPICDRVNILKKITYSNINNWTPVIEYTTKSECILLVDGTVKISTNVPYDGVSGLDVFIQDMWTHLVADKTGTVILPIHWNGLMPLNGKFIVYLGLGEQYTYIINEDSSSDARAFCCNFTELPLGK